MYWLIILSVKMVRTVVFEWWHRHDFNELIQAACSTTKSKRFSVFNVIEDCIVVFGEQNKLPIKGGKEKGSNLATYGTYVYMIMRW